MIFILLSTHASGGSIVDEQDEGSAMTIEIGPEQYDSIKGRAAVAHLGQQPHPCFRLALVEIPSANGLMSMQK